MKTKIVGTGLLIAGVTLVGAESAELIQIKDPAKHMETEAYRPLDIGKFKFITAVTTIAPIRYYEIR